MRDHIARSYAWRENIRANAAGRYVYPCPTCRGRGTVPRYLAGKMAPATCDACAGDGALHAAHRSGIPAAPRPIYVHDVSVVGGRGHYSERERWSDTEPSPRRAWEQSARDVPTMTETGESWQAIVWRLPNRRGYVAGYYNGLSESYVWDTRPDAWQGSDWQGSEDYDDTRREACRMAERAAEEECESVAAREYAWGEGREAGRAGKLSGDNPYTPRVDGYGEEEEWETARADAYADAAREAGEADGKSGAPMDPDAWPADRLAYLEGHAAGYAALTHAARRAGLLRPVTP